MVKLARLLTVFSYAIWGLQGFTGSSPFLIMIAKMPRLALNFLGMSSRRQQSDLNKRGGCSRILVNESNESE